MTYNCAKCGKEFERNEAAIKKATYCKDPACIKIRINEAVKKSQAKKKQERFAAAAVEPSVAVLME